MKTHGKIYVFGEVLYDCFPDGQTILGGAPFNVAWHLQALGDQPVFISRVGRDEHGDSVLQAMKEWGMGLAGVQIDKNFATGQVEVTFKDNEPDYNIVNNSAYDFISSEELPENIGEGILYHGSLGLRGKSSRKAYETLTENKKLKVFLDVNLRSPWWEKNELLNMLASATWVKMNLDELQLLANSSTSVETQMAELQARYGIEQLIVTQGEEGALIRTEDGGFHSLIPEKAESFVDTVGAGDAFSSMYIHGLCAGLPIDTNLYNAQKFAGKVVGLRGATTTNLDLYRDF